MANKKLKRKNKKNKKGEYVLTDDAPTLGSLQAQIDALRLEVENIKKKTA